MTFDFNYFLPRWEPDIALISILSLKWHADSHVSRCDANLF